MANTSTMAVKILNPAPLPKLTTKMGKGILFLGAICKATVGSYPRIGNYDNEQAIDTNISTQQ